SIEENEMLEEGKKPIEIFRENKYKIPYCRDYGTIPFTIFCYGDGGSGKSGFAQSFFDEDDLYVKNEYPRNGKHFWLGYEDQLAVFFDEFYNKIRWENILDVLNDTKCPLEVKGKNETVNFNSRYAILTGRMNPRESFEHVKASGYLFVFIIFSNINNLETVFKYQMSSFQQEINFEYNNIINYLVNKIEFLEKTYIDKMIENLDIKYEKNIFTTTLKDKLKSIIENQRQDSILSIEQKLQLILNASIEIQKIK
ncbi:3181_t:CDS:2, partial [Gigaspora margarita]